MSKDDTLIQSTFFTDIHFDVSGQSSLLFCFRADTLEFTAAPGTYTLINSWHFSDSVLGWVNAAIAWDTLSFSVGSLVSLSENKLEELKLYPNPSQGVFQIELDNQAHAVYQLQLYDIKGRLLLEEELEQSKTLNMGHLPSGIYHCRLVYNSGLVKTDKVVIKKH